MVTYSNTSNNLASHRIARALTPNVLTHLQNFGFAILDGVLSNNPTNPSPSPSSVPTLADDFRSSILSLHQSHRSTLNHTHLMIRQFQPNGPPIPRTILMPKQSIYETDFTIQQDLTDQEPWKDFTQSNAILNKLNQHFQSNQPSESITFTSQTAKAQVCQGNGGCFPRQ